MLKTKNRNITKKLLILGCGGHAKVVTEIAESVGFNEFYYHDINTENNKFLGRDVFHEDINHYFGYFFVPIGDNFIRERVTKNFQLNNPNSINKTLIHPSSQISESCSIGEGSVIMPLCVVNSHSQVGSGVIINTHSSIDHDNKIMNFSSIAPGVITGGNVSIGYRTAISLGAIIRNDIEIGPDNVIGASSYINRNITNKKVVYGSPGREIRTRNIGDKYL